MTEDDTSSAVARGLIHGGPCGPVLGLIKGLSGQFPKSTLNRHRSCNFPLFFPTPSPMFSWGCMNKKFALVQVLKNQDRLTAPDILEVHFSPPVHPKRLRFLREICPVFPNSRESADSAKNIFSVGGPEQRRSRTLQRVWSGDGPGAAARFRFCNGETARPGWSASHKPRIILRFCSNPLRVPLAIAIVPEAEMG